MFHKNKPSATRHGARTLMGLLGRYYDPRRGRILVDGVDIRHVTTRSLRNQISVVLQEQMLFRRIPHERTRDADPLALAAGGPDAALPDERLVVVRQPRGEVVRVRGRRHRLDVGRPSGSRAACRRSGTRIGSSS
jgi:hypothetical protein